MDALDDLLIKRYSELVSDEPARLHTPSTPSSQTAEVQEEVTSTMASDESDDDSVADGSSTENDQETPDAEAPTAVENRSVENRSVDISAEEVATVAKDTKVQELKPAWEVDRFLWPAICGKVEDVLESNLLATVESIRAECSQREHRVVAIVNTDRGSGGTTVTMCLAREAARQGLRVALVDLNHEHPNLSENLGIDCEQGIESLQLADVDVEDICVAAIEDGVTLVPLLRSIDVRYGTSWTTRDLLHRLETTHDLVLVDTTGPIVQGLSDESPRVGMGVILVEKASDTATEFTQPETGSSWELGTIKNFAA